MSHPEYRNVSAAVRPPRCAVLIDATSKLWQSAARDVIAHASEVWGGQGFLLIPTDGNTIHSKFWELLEAYSPDHIAIYIQTFANLERDDPETYEKVKDARHQWWKENGFAGDFNSWFADEAEHSSLNPEFVVSSSLEKELLSRLSPFHFDERCVREHLSSRNGFGYPFTKVVRIVTAAKRQVEWVYLPKSYGDPIIDLFVESYTGMMSKEAIGQLADQGIGASSPFEGTSAADFLKLAFAWTFPRDNSGQDVRQFATLANTTPFGISSVQLDRYYTTQRHSPHREPLTVILGDTVEDFCLYYSLSRMHGGVCWFPLQWLRDCAKALRRRSILRDEGVEPGDLDEAASRARTLINYFFELVGFGHHELRINLRSMSLSRRQLIAYRTQMDACSYFSGRFRRVVDCVDISATSTQCVARFYETNNYANEAIVGFVDGISMSPYATPKPKNFVEIRLPDHYWLTELQIENFSPPVLPGLGVKIVNIHDVSTESRVAVSGIVYQCPNFAYFGSGDADTNTVRPRLRVLDQIDLLGEYFSTIGVRLKLSDKGNYVADTVERFGGLDQVGKFLSTRGTRTVFDRFLSTGTSANGNIVWIDNDRRCYLNFDAIVACVGTQDEAAALIDELIGRNILQRGYLLQCERCRLASWYGISVLTDHFKCTRCSFRQQYTRRHWKTTAEPRWFYRLAETVYQFHLSRSHLTIHSLYRLRSESKIAFHYMPEVDLIDFPEAGKKKELDIACIVDGVIVLGECKTEPFHAKDIAKFEMLNSRLSKRPGRIVFATNLPKVSTHFIERVAALGNGEIMNFSESYGS